MNGDHQFVSNNSNINHFHKEAGFSIFGFSRSTHPDNIISPTLLSKIQNLADNQNLDEIPNQKEYRICDILKEEWGKSLKGQTESEGLREAKFLGLQTFKNFYWFGQNCKMRILTDRPVKESPKVPDLEDRQISVDVFGGKKKIINYDYSYAYAIKSDKVKSNNLNNSLQKSISEINLKSKKSKPNSSFGHRRGRSTDFNNPEGRGNPPSPIYFTEPNIVDSDGITSMIIVDTKTGDNPERGFKELNADDISDKKDLKNHLYDVNNKDQVIYIIHLKTKNNCVVLRSNTASTLGSSRPVSEVSGGSQNFDEEGASLMSTLTESVPLMKLQDSASAEDSEYENANCHQKMTTKLKRNALAKLDFDKKRNFQQHQRHQRHLNRHGLMNNQTVDSDVATADGVSKNATLTGPTAQDLLTPDTTISIPLKTPLLLDLGPDAYTNQPTVAYPDTQTNSFDPNAPTTRIPSNDEFPSSNHDKIRQNHQDNLNLDEIEKENINSIEIDNPVKAKAQKFIYTRFINSKTGQPHNTVDLEPDCYPGNHEELIRGMKKKEIKIMAAVNFDCFDDVF